MSKYLFDDDIRGPRCEQQCYVPVEDIRGRIERQLCKPQKPCCPPRTKARDAIRIGKKKCHGVSITGVDYCDSFAE